MAADSVDVRLGVFENRLEHVEQDVGYMRGEISDLRRTMITLFLWVLGLQVAMFGAIGAVGWRVMAVSNSLTEHDGLIRQVLERLP